MTEPRVNDQGGEPGRLASADAEPTGEEQWSSRLIRDTAARAAALRDTWDRSYSSARSSATGTTDDQPDPATSSPDRLAEIIAEQRRTNGLLSEVLAELRRRR